MYEYARAPVGRKKVKVAQPREKEKEKNKRLRRREFNANYRLIYYFCEIFQHKMPKKKVAIVFEVLLPILASLGEIFMINCLSCLFNFLSFLHGYLTQLQ